MNEPRQSDFRPRWYSDAKAEDLPALEAEPWIGSQPLVFTRITTRVLPSENVASLPASALVEILEQTQKIVRFAAYDVANGPNPDFADLRSIGPELMQFSNLTIEPFSEGSFVIPARLEADPIECPNGGNLTITTDELANRFRAILSNLGDRNEASNVSVGALQAVDGLRRVLNKTGAEVEYITTDSYSASKQFRTDHHFWDKVSRWLVHRRPTSQALEELEGKVTSLDIVQGKLLLSVTLGEDRIPGYFPTMLHPKLLNSLGRRVRLFGLIERKSGRPKRINIQDSEFLDDE